MVARHLEWMGLRGLSASYIARRQRMLAGLSVHLGQTPLLKASPGQLLAWRASLGVADDAAAVYVSHITQFYRWAAETGRVSGSPAAGLPVAHRADRLPRPATEDDVVRAVLGAPPRIRPWLVLAGWCGLRAVEIAYLRRECVLETLPQPALLIARGATKGRHERLVPMCEFACAELLPVLPARGWVFRRGDGLPGPNTPGTVSHLANAYLHDIGISATLHQFRHRFATEAQRVARDIRVVQRLLGHKHVKSTEVYAAFDDTAAAAAVHGLAVPGPRRLRQARS